MSIQKDPFDRRFDSFVTLADMICDVLQCPVTIENANHQLIAYSSHSPHTDPARIATIIGRRVPEQVIGALWRNGVIQRLMESEEPVRIAAVRDVGLGDRIAIAIRKASEILGYIWVMEENRRLDQADYSLLKKASEASKHLMLQLQIQKRKEEEGQQNLFWQLLTGHLKSAGAIRERAEQLHIALPASYRVSVFEFAREITGELLQRIQYMITTTQRVKILFHVPDGMQLVLLTAADGGNKAHERENAAAGLGDFIGDFIAQMTERFGTGPKDGASSSEYGDYTMVEQGWQEAVAVLELKKRFPEALAHTRQYGELGFYRFLPAMAELDRTRRHESRFLPRLKAYDGEHHSCLVETLSAFLQHDGSLKETADALHIHINTLNYRLKRISDIGGIDLKNTDHKVTAYLELKLDRLAR
ncbi:helix-turn-helix domain-containing protein [Paenibacillus doosanensis]|uniref:PucR family transcriptional regulator n=1 Tax=Paenibacillus doosanensis TaxID=1229154 RepID=UPI00217FC444|nr:helix-turn-helix domain-containing protein [Paenibacillus doosanensis]MCS7464825.1 helix-turn-helix domain-containing protein [Paenibacillus doosanensis]